MREIEKQIDGFKNEIKQGLLTVEEKEKIIDQLRKELVDRDSKYNNLTEKFNKKQTQPKITSTILRRTIAQEGGSKGPQTVSGADR
jgi:hypothetical protein